MARRYLLILLAVFFVGCSGDKNPEERITLVKQEKVKPKLKIYPLHPRTVPDPEMKTFKSKLKELPIMMEAHVGFRFHEAIGRDQEYYIIHVLERVELGVYPTNFVITYYPKEKYEDYSLEYFYEKEKVRWEHLRGFELGEDHQEKILDNDVIFRNITYERIFPLRVIPQKTVNIQEKVGFFMNDGRIYKVRFLALHDEFTHKLEYYRRFAHSLTFIS